MHRRACNRDSDHATGPADYPASAANVNNGCADFNNTPDRDADNCGANDNTGHNRNNNHNSGSGNYHARAD